jgi:hypothetical protein
MEELAKRVANRGQNPVFARQSIDAKTVAILSLSIGARSIAPLAGNPSGLGARLRQVGADPADERSRT